MIRRKHSLSEMPGSNLIDGALDRIATGYFGQKALGSIRFTHVILLSRRRKFMYCLTFGRAKRAKVLILSNFASRGAREKYTI